MSSSENTADDTDSDFKPDDGDSGTHCSSIDSLLVSEETEEDQAEPTSNERFPQPTADS